MPVHTHPSVKTSQNSDFRSYLFILFKGISTRSGLGSN